MRTRSGNTARSNRVPNCCQRLKRDRWGREKVMNHTSSIFWDAGFQENQVEAWPRLTRSWWGYHPPAVWRASEGTVFVVNEAGSSGERREQAFIGP